VLSVSILVSTYNYANYIATALESVLDQILPEFRITEAIIIDDGSNDNTETVLLGFRSAAKLLYSWQPNSGKAAATRKGIELATGDIICLLDADDWYLPGKLEATLRIFEQYPDVVHVASPAQIVWEDGSREPVAEPVPASLLGKELNGLQLLQTFYRQNILFGGGSTFAARATVLKQMPWDDAIDMYTDEWLLLWTLLQGNSYFLPQPLSVWRIHGQNYSGKGGEALQTKNRRLHKSSTAVLRAMQQHNFPAWLQQLYTLKHAVREMHWKELEGNKTMADRWRFFKDVILSGGYSPAMLWNHHAFNRVWK
jgi:glycosyltransferase involved in cell wall biosynthesis